MTFTAANLCQLYQTALLQSAKDKPEKEISRVYCTDDKYEVRLEIQNFQPDEISVKAVDRYILVEGRHEERGERLGLISHQFTRRYVLPDGVNPENISCSLTSNGILTLAAPRHLENVPKKEVKITIHQAKDANAATVFDVTSPQKERGPSVERH